MAKNVYDLFAKCCKKILLYVNDRKHQADLRGTKVTICVF